MFLLHTVYTKSKSPDYTVNGKDLKKVKTDLKINDRGSNTVLFCKKGGKKKRKLSHETGVSKAEYIYIHVGLPETRGNAVYFSNAELNSLYNP